MDEATRKVMEDLRAKGYEVTDVGGGRLWVKIGDVVVSIEVEGYVFLGK